MPFVDTIVTNEEKKLLTATGGPINGTTVDAISVCNISPSILSVSLFKVKKSEDRFYLINNISVQPKNTFIYGGVKIDKDWDLYVGVNNGSGSVSGSWINSNI